MLSSLSIYSIFAFAASFRTTGAFNARPTPACPSLVSRSAGGFRLRKSRQQNPFTSFVPWGYQCHYRYRHQYDSINSIESQALLSSTSENHDNNPDACTADEWKKLSDIMTLETPWFTLLGERLLDDRHRTLDYYRVRRSHSAVIIVIHKGSNSILLPRKAQYRPGVQQATLDFCGGRIGSHARSIGDVMDSVIPHILERELGDLVSSYVDDVESVSCLNHGAHPAATCEDIGWPVDSSFSSQRLLGFVAHLREDLMEHSENDGKVVTATGLPDSVVAYPRTREGMDGLLVDLQCLQCRSVLLEYLRDESTHV
mmetsp:Transcript_37967/g.77275  ORF Transcript_37967/g.77275 Transcript_37967/m.77275 type:complete len:313 (-) Transcript_37967:390-1328(-)